MIYVIIENFEADIQVINGGSQSSRNLISGLHAIQKRKSINIISWTRHDRPKSIAQSALTFKPCIFGNIASIELPVIQEWKHIDLISTLSFILKKIEQKKHVFHLLEAKEYLGSWLAALASTEFKVVVTALDYAWICANSHLLTRTSEQCLGPKDASSCLQCHYNHRNIFKKVALKLLLTSTNTPLKNQKIYPEKLANIAQKAAKKRQMTEMRLANLRQDFQSIDALIAPSQCLKKFFAKNGLPEEKIFHVPYGTQPGKKIKFLERPSEGIVFGFVGKLTFDKGLDLLIEALSQVRQNSFQNISLVVYAGQDNSGFGKQMMRKINELSWITQGQFNGRDPQSIDDAHRKINFQVAPSRWTDNLPNAVLEGIERHTPIIAPEYGSFLEMVEDGVNGWLYPDNTVSELNKLLTNIVRNPARFAQLPFDDRTTRLPEAEAEDILQIYQKLLPSL